MQKIEQLLKSNQVAIILERSGKSSIDFQLKISDTNCADPDDEKDVEVLASVAAGMIAHMSERANELYTAGKKVLAVAKEINTT